MVDRTRRRPKSRKAGGGAPIAVIGIGCRVPGAHNPDDFWSLLSDGVDAVQDIPADRFDAEALYDPEPNTPGRIISRKGGYLENVDQFDSGFFGISPREASAMDPQQRLLLECAWEALEDAGLPLARVSGTQTGVFVGADSANYWELQHREQPHIYGVMGGGARSAIAGRLSFVLDTRGPSITIDAACASSLVAVHMACQSLRSGESEIAVAVGAHMIMAPWESIAFSQAGMLSAKGRCAFGDASADGFVRSEAIGVVVLKPLDRALADGDPVRAVIRGSAVSNDGAGSGLLMSPAVEGQTIMLRNAYADAGINPADVDFVEAHGTGTQAGDPVELQALADVLGPGREAGKRAWVGSAKTNLGHSEAAAGIVGLIKTVLSLQHRAVPGVLHHTVPNPKIPWDDLPLAVPRMIQPLDEDRQLIAGVSAFGISGTNAHVVLTSPEPRPEAGLRHTDVATAEGGDAQVLVLSARSAEALRDLVRFYLSYLGPGGEGRRHSLRDICYTAATRRTHHEYRVAVVGDSHETIADALRSSLHATERPAPAGRPKVAFVFPGQGSQWTGMGRELLQLSPAFRTAIRACDDAIRAEAGWSLIEKLEDPRTVWEGIDLVQPALWAMEVALAETWKAWGVRPDLVIGHSMGEAAASYVAGALDLADSAAVICRRSKLMAQVAGRGAMAVVELPADEAAALIEDPAAVSVAAYNSPTSTVLAGDPEALTAIKERLDARDVFCRLVQVDVASHSHQVEPLLEELAAVLGTLAPHATTVPLHSTVRDQVIDGTEMDAAYWVRNLRDPVRFVHAVSAARDAGATAFVEISPHPVLGHPVEETVRGTASRSLTSLRRMQPEREAMLGTWARLYEAGAELLPELLYPGGRNVPLPHYPWQRERYWLEESLTRPGPHVTTVVLDPAAEAYLTQHRIRGTALVPGTVLLDAVRSARAAAAGEGPVALTDVTFTEALLVEATGPVRLRVTLEPGPAGSHRFTVDSQQGTIPPREAAGESAEGVWTTHATGTVGALADAGPAPEHLGETLTRCPAGWQAADFYATAAAAGADWGPANQAVTGLWSGTGEAVAQLRLPGGLPAGAPAVHPALLEAAAQPLMAAFEQPEPFVAAGIAEVHYLGDAAEVWSQVRVTASAPDGTAEADVILLDDQHRVVARMLGLKLVRLRESRPEAVPQQAGGADPAAVSGPTVLPAAAGSGALAAPTERGLGSVEITGEIRIRDAQERLIVELSGTLRLGGAGQAPAVTVAAADRQAVPALSVPVPAGVAQAAPALPVPIPAPRNGVRGGAAAPAARPVAPQPAAAPLRTAAPQPPVPAPAAPAAPAAPVAAEAEGSTLDQVISEIAAVLRMPTGRVEPTRGLTQLGLDSLMALELKSRLQRGPGLDVTVQQLLKAPSVEALAEELASRKVQRA